MFGTSNRFEFVLFVIIAWCVGFMLTLGAAGGVS